MQGKSYILLLVLAGSAFCWVNYGKSSENNKHSVPSVVTNGNKNSTAKVELSRLKNYGNTIKKYAEKNNYNSEYCFLIDMKLPSGNKRFFIYDFKKDSILDAGLVTHGSGSDTDSSLIFSNVIGSNSTSLGKYKIGYSYHGKFGLAYKLYGLDKTNSNAFNRFVVLHSHSCVPENDVTPDPICLSWGCPTVNPTFLNKLTTYIDNAKKPVLLQIFH